MAQLVEHNLAKVGVAGSSPVVRSMIYQAGLLTGFFITHPRMRSDRTGQNRIP